jgi:hypothetical protein
VCEFVRELLLTPSETLRIHYFLPEQVAHEHLRELLKYHPINFVATRPPISVNRNARPW